MVMKKILMIVIASLLSVYLFGQEQAILRDIVGQVEVMPPGKNWEPATINMALPVGTVISTGFKSFATIQVGAASLQVKALTRIAISELIQTQNSQKTTVNLKVGRVHAKVEKVEGLEHDFTVKSPVSTAAVRGTEFEFNGRRLQVQEGIVRFSNNVHQYHSIRQGESSQITGFSPPSSSEQSLIAETQTVISTNPAGGGGSRGSNVSVMGTLKITLE
jgi:hypothetical protein